MEKRLILAVVLCLVLVIVYNWLFAPKPAPPPAQQTPASQPVVVQAPASAPASTPTATSRPAANLAPYARAPEQTPTVTVPGMASITLSSWGADLVSDLLLSPRYTEKLSGKVVQIDLARLPKDHASRPLRVGFEDARFRYDDSVDYEVRRPSADEVDFTQSRPERSDVAITKRYVFDPASYRFELTVEVRNIATHPIDEKLAVFDSGWQNPATASTGFMSRYTARITSAMCYVDGKLQAKNGETLHKDGPYEASGDIPWLGIDQRYFLLALVPHGGPAAASCRARDLGEGVLQAELVYESQRLQPGQSLTYRLGVFAGPKLYNVLQGVGYPGLNPELGTSVQFGMFAFIAKPLLWILRAFQRLAVNWGVAIILLTIFVKLITFYWTNKSMLAMREMSRLTPKINALKERYAGDKQRLNQEMMNLYKAHNINPAAGCLPMVLQMPVWFALYEALENAVELYNAPFAFWIHDLAAPDPYYVVPIAMGVLMIFQQKMTPTTVSSDQQKMMMYMMPIVFTFMSLMLPVGLSIYIVVNSILTMIHQGWLNRHYPMTGAPAVAGKKKSA